MLDLSVIVCTHGRPEALARFLPPLAQAVNTCGLSAELLVIDDGSEPPVTAPCVVVRQPHLGAAAARNRGARTAVAAKPRRNAGGLVLGMADCASLIRPTD